MRNLLAIGALAATSALCCLLAPLPASAIPISYDFSVTATTGPLNGTTASGSFSYDSSIVVPGSTIIAVGLLTDLDFTWNGIAYTEATANTGALGFDGSGGLILLQIGNDCNPGPFCSIGGGGERWVLNSPTLFLYSVAGGESIDFGSVVLTPAEVPEPITLALFGAGLAGVIAIGRKRRSNASAVHR